MINNIEITKSVNSLCDKEQMLKHCYDNIVMLDDNHINNISNITFNI